MPNSQFETALRYFENQDFISAEKILLHLLQQEPQNQNVPNLLGQIQQSRQNHQGALEFFKKALQLDPANSDLSTNIAISLYALKQPLEAVIFLSKAWALKPDSKSALQKIQTILTDRVTAKTLIKSWQQIRNQNLSPEIKHRYHNALCQAAELYQQMNDWSSSRFLCDEVLAENAKHNHARILLTKIHLRDKQTEQAEAVIKGMDFASLPDNQRSNCENLCAIIAERQQHFPLAYTHYRAANDILLQAYLKKHTLDLDFSWIKQWTDFFTTQSEDIFSTHMDIEQPEETLFLIGFPRSGTTLLDQILSSHSELQAIEEKNIFAHAFAPVLKPEFKAENLLQLSKDDVYAMRESYFALLQSFAPKGIAQNKAVTLIDKHPLNISRLGLLKFFFPKSKFIVALRDPRDVCWSCFTQQFEVNAAMAYFLDLKTTAQFYRAVMEHYLSLQKRPTLKSFEIRYESITTDLKSTVEPLLNFLNLSWEDALLDFNKAAHKRHIATPSSSQVSQNLYQSSVGKWQNYDFALKDILPELKDVSEALGFKS